VDGRASSGRNRGGEREVELEGKEEGRRGMILKRGKCYIGVIRVRYRELGGGRYVQYR
jgi:hypothetical protein